MADLRMEQTQSLQLRQEQRQVLRMEQANLLEMPEDEFQKLLAEVENSPLFRRLYQKEHLINYKRYPGTEISSSFYALDEGVVADKSSGDVESLLQDKEHIVQLIKKLGEEKFKHFFLFPESGMMAEEIAGECGLTVPEVQKINNLIDSFSVLSEFYHPSAISTEVVHYAKVGTVEKGREGFIISYYSPSLARGRYSIDYGRFEELKSAGAFSEAESREARRLFRKLELINSRKDTLAQIIQAIIDRQALYLDSRDLKALLPFSQKELASKIGLVPSSVSRAISGKSIGTPWGEEVPLKSFFPGPKKFKKELLKQIIETEEGLSSDEAIRGRLREKFGIAVSRRSVANLRKEMKIPAAGRRGKPKTEVRE